MKLTISDITKNLKNKTVRNIGGAMLTQGMLSIANFLISFLTAKYAAKSEYATFVILYSIISIFGNYQIALINTPLMVIYQEKKETERKLYIDSLSIGQWVIFIPVIVVSTIAFVVYYHNQSENSIMNYVLVLSFGTMMFLYREFIRSVNYCKMRILDLIKMDTLFMILIAIGILLMAFYGTLTCISTILLLSFGYILSGLYGSFHSKSRSIAKWDSIKKAIAANWELGRWSLVGVTSNIFMNRGYIYIVSIYLGLDDIAEISAARLFLMPIGLFITSSVKIITAKGSEIYQSKGMAKFRTFIGIILLGMVIGSLLYIITISIIRSQIIEWVGAEKYGNIRDYITLWSIYFLIYATRNPITRALIVIKEFRSIAIIDTICAMVTIVVCFFMIQYKGGYGAVISMISGEVTMLVLAVLIVIGVYLKKNSIQLLK